MAEPKAQPWCHAHRHVGDAPYKPLTELSYEDLLAGTADKLLGQVELVRRGIAHVADDGSFTVFPGFLSVPLRDVAATHVRSIEGAETGRVYELGD